MIYAVCDNAYTSSVRRIFERGGGGGGGQEFENYKDQNEKLSAQNQVRFSAQN